MIDFSEREFKADVFHTAHATADTIQEINDEAETLLGLTIACKEDQFLYIVTQSGCVVKTNLRSRTVI